MKDYCKKLSEKPWLMTMLTAVLAVLLYLPCDRFMNPLSDGTLAHSTIVNALQAGNNWGRQALVGNTDYPALQTLMLLVSDTLCNVFSLVKVTLSPVMLLASLSFAVMLAYFIRILLLVGRPQFIPIPLLAAFLIPVSRISLKSATPDLIVMMFLSAVTYHIIAWSRSKSIRSMVMAAAYNGILCLCGVPCAIAAIATAIVFYIAVRKNLAENGPPCDGIRSRLWSTAAYCLALWFLWNWLVMDNAFFGLSDIFMRLRCAPKTIHLVWSSSPLTLTALVFIAPLIILCMKTDCGTAAKCVLAQVIVLIVSSSFAKGLKLAQTGILPMAVFAIMATFTLCAASEFRHKVPRTCCILALALCVFFSCRAQRMSRRLREASGEDIVWRGHNASGALLGINWKESLDVALFNPDQQRPTAEEITEYIDNFWPMSRVMLYGLRLPICYPDTAEKRFVARLDYQESDLLRQAQDEQLHILVPPLDGIFYPAKGHPLADIHENGRPWLLLERTWQGGWQLWRVAIPPANESKLDIFR
ncbi:MAG: hypothetical protein IJS15_11755 [Victivallales bacterium]|nr:hypothetical protein [Victivallales bacterium]